MATRNADVVSGRFPAGETRTPRPGGDVPAWKRLAFYVGIPLVICLYGTLNNWKLLDSLGFLSTFGFYAAHAAAPWAVTALLTLIAWRALARWKPGLITLTVLGSLASCAITLPYTAWLTAAWAGSAAATALGGEPASPGAWWGDILGYALRATLVWVGANLLFDRFLAYPRYRYASPVRTPGGPQPAPAGNPAITAATDGGSLPPFMQRLKKPVSLDSLLAIRAEQHYLRVITATGRELVLYRLGDAIRELPSELGIQVHRSWWVRSDAIVAVEARGKKMTLVLPNDLRVPVSTPYQALVRTVTSTSPPTA